MINQLRAPVLPRRSLPATASAYPPASAQITTSLPHLPPLHKEEVAKYVGYEDEQSVQQQTAAGYGLQMRDKRKTPVQHITC